MKKILFLVPPQKPKGKSKINIRLPEIVQLGKKAVVTFCSSDSLFNVFSWLGVHFLSDHPKAKRKIHAKF